MGYAFGFALEMLDAKVAKELVEVCDVLNRAVGDPFDVELTRGWMAVKLLWFRK